MPHNCVGPEELDSLYPNLEAVPDIPLHDLVRLEDDALYAAGMKVVQQILDDMASMGRTKRSFAPEVIETTVNSLESAAAGCTEPGDTIWGLNCVIFRKDSPLYGEQLQRPPCPPRCGGVRNSARLRQVCIEHDGAVDCTVLTNLLLSVSERAT